MTYFGNIKIYTRQVGKNSRITLYKRTLYSEKNMNSLNVEYFLAMDIQNLDKNG